MITYNSWLCRSIPLLLLALVSAKEGIRQPVHPHADIEEDIHTFSSRGLEGDQGIIGGDVALGEEYPFFALLYRSRNDFAYVCGGTLIAPGKYAPDPLWVKGSLDVTLQWNH